jgi:hypothetical protein
MGFDGASYQQKTFKYHAWSLGQLLRKYEKVAGDAELAEVLKQTGCAEPLAMARGLVAA